MSYKVKELYLSIQGEGFHTGQTAVFCRFSGCNLWTGREADRQKAVCQFCDTDFLGTDGPGGGVYSTADELVNSIRSCWRDKDTRPFAVFTGGEPLLQVDRNLIDELRKRNVFSALETNGTLDIPGGIGWTCISPKAGSTLVAKHGNELKLVYPQAGIDPELYLDLDFEHFFIQPMDGPDLARNTELAVKYVRDHPRWKLSLQTHKYIRIP